MTAAADGRASAQDWLAVFAGALGALIATLDISIVNSALPQIQGEIGATGTEGTWIATGYLVSEVVMIPLSAWLSRLLGMRTLLLTCSSLFTLFSVLCGFSSSLTVMIIGRIGQGFFGGALIPTAQTIVRTRLPPSQIPLGMTLFGLIVLLGPLMGPIVGGWLTENWSWQWCFFINIPVALALGFLLLTGMSYEPPSLDELIQADWLGIAGLAMGLSCLTVVLEEGQREQWFQSNLIISLSICALIGLSVLAYAQLISPKPIIKLRLLQNRTYASVILIVISIGMVLYDILYVLPQFLGTIAGYNIHLTAQSAGGNFVLSQLLRGFGQILAFMPLNQLSVGAVGRQDTADAAGLFNMARNLGGSIGLALQGVFIDRRTELHADAIRESVTANAMLLQERLAGQAAFFNERSSDAMYANGQAMAQLAQRIHQQAMVMTYSDCFWVLGMGLIALMPMVLILRRPAPPAAAPVGAT